MNGDDIGAGQATGGITTEPVYLYQYLIWHRLTQIVMLLILSGFVLGLLKLLSSDQSQLVKDILTVIVPAFTFALGSTTASRDGQ